MARTIKFINFSCDLGREVCRRTFKGAGGFSFSPQTGHDGQSCCEVNFGGSMSVSGFVNYNCSVASECGFSSTLYTVPAGKVAKVVPRYISMKADAAATVGLVFTSGGWGNSMPCTAYSVAYCATTSHDARATNCLHFCNLERCGEYKVGYEIGVTHGGTNRVAPGYGYMNLGSAIASDSFASYVERKNWSWYAGDIRNINNYYRSLSDSTIYSAECSYTEWTWPCCSGAQIADGGAWNVQGRCKGGVVLADLCAKIQVNQTPLGALFDGDDFATYCSSYPGTYCSCGYCIYGNQNLIRHKASAMAAGSTETCYWNNNETFRQMNDSFTRDGLISSVSGLTSFYLNAGETIEANLKTYASYSISHGSSWDCATLCTFNTYSASIQVSVGSVFDGLYTDWDFGLIASYLVIEEDTE